MATVDKDGSLRGAIGNIVLRKGRRKSIAQQKPGKVKMTAETKKCSSEFGRANTASARIRAGIRHFLTGLADSEMHGRFTGQIFHAMRHSAVEGGGLTPIGKRRIADVNLSLLEGFEFNDNTAFRDYCTVMPSFEVTDGILTISLPAINAYYDIKNVRETTKFELVFGVATYEPAFDTVSPVRNEEFRITGQNMSAIIEEQHWQSQLIKTGNTVLVVGAVLYYGKTALNGPELLNHRELHPCALLSAFRV